MMYLANVYLALLFDGTATVVCQQRRRLRFLEAFKNGLNGLFGDRQNIQKGRRTTKILTQRSGSTRSYIQRRLILGLLQEDKSSDERRRKVSHLMKESVAEGYLSGPLDEKSTTQQVLSNGATISKI
ncbi:hypothetical protein TNCV_1170471 [Trichonephila clavipes]|nr:hypothetical protein TNCV_1170471 [Trichonephila clavipes]